MNEEKKFCPDDFRVAECLQMARLLIETYSDMRSVEVDSLKEEFSPEEAEAIRQAVLRLRRLTTAYESRYEYPYSFGEQLFDKGQWRRHFEGNV